MEFIRISYGSGRRGCGHWSYCNTRRLRVTVRILEREFEQYEDAEYGRLSSISVAHIYNLRQRRRCREWLDELHQDINAVDEVTQWQVVELRRPSRSCIRSRLYGRFWSSFRCPSVAFIPGNGSEFINEMVSGLLKELPIKQTKSRARKSNGNGLVECENGAAVRKHIGYGYIVAGHAADINAFYQGTSIRT